MKFNLLKINSELESLKNNLPILLKSKSSIGNSKTNNSCLFSSISSLNFSFKVLISTIFFEESIGNSKIFFSKSTIDYFNQCYYCKKGNRRGLGFDKPQIDDSSPTCGCVPMSSFGHSGFTGTYAWADPDNQIVYVFLSNRTYPSMNNNKLSKNNIRTEIQRIIYNSLK